MSEEDRIACRRAIVAAPGEADAWFVWAVTAGQPRDMARALALEPGHAGATVNLAAWFLSQAATAPAMRLLKRALASKPTLPEAMGNLALVAMSANDYARAVQILGRILTTRPDDALTLINLGVALDGTGDPRAVQVLTKAGAINSGQPLAQLNLAVVLKKRGLVAEAASALRRTLVLEPRSGEAATLLGGVHGETGDAQRGLVWLGRRLSLDLVDRGAASTLGQLLRQVGDLVAGGRWLRIAHALDPAGLEPLNNLGTLYQEMGDVASALRQFKHFLFLQPGNPAAWSNWLFGLHFSVGVGAEAIASAHREFGRVVGGGGGQVAARRRGSGDRLRVGFVSADFRRHAVAWFLLPVLSGRAAGAWEAVCYSDAVVEDEVSREFRRLADGFRPIVGMSDEKLVDLVRADGIDVVFDLAGHTSGNRLGAFARRLAPVQATWLGYADTTGLASMDVLVADRIVVPAGTEHRYVERVERLADGFACYQPPLEAEAVAALPALGGAPFTFGCLTQLAKVNDAVLALWAQALAAAPKSRLMMQSAAFDDPAGRARMQARLAALGVAERRLSLVGRLPHRRILELFAGVDLMLDTFPMGGGTTTCEALWHGVPVLTLPSDLYCGRHTASHLANLGLEGFTAADPQDFVAKAAAWATDPEALAAIRATLRPRMATSPLADKTRFAISFLNLINKIAK